MRAVLLLLAGCGPTVGDPVDTGAPADDQPADDLSCDVLELDVLGEEEPSVGDSWTVWLRCDGATLAGASKLSFDPPDFAQIDVNVATFLYAGSATMKMQVGSFSEEMEVVVAD